MFVGRTAELTLLRAQLRAAVGGDSRTVVVEGPEGIGKTTLVHRTLGEEGVRVLAASGEASERRLRLGVVRQLADAAAGWEGTPRRIGLAGRDSCAAGQALYEVVDRLQAEGPVAVVVDDAQWADRPSLRALSYMLRRVRAWRVLVVVVCRDVADPWLPEGLRRLLTGTDTRRVTLGGLSAGDLAELAGQAMPQQSEDAKPACGVRDPAPGQVSGLAPQVSGLAPQVSRVAPQVAVRLREHTGGNPLHARALLASVPAAVLAEPGVRLPAPDTYLRPFARRLHGCDPAVRRLVAACAVLGGPCPLHLAAAVADGLREPLDALEAAVAAGLLRELPGRLVDFPEPLARAAAYDGLGAGTRARLHLAAARAVTDTGAALRHRAAAAGGPDEGLAEELASFAAKAAQHGQWQESAAHLDLAAGLTESAVRRDELRTSVLEHVLVGGDVIRAAELADVRNADPRPVRRYVLGRLALALGRFDEASELLAEAWRHREPGFAADVAEQLAWLHLVTADREAAVNWARLALDQPIQGPVARPYDVLALGGAPSAGTPPDSLAAALALLERDAAEEAATVLGRTVAAAAKAGLPHHRLLATALLAVAEHGAARWNEAAARAEEALAEAAALGQRWLLPCLEVVCVAPLAALGEHERALAHATAAGTTARRLRHPLGETQAALALALLGAGNEPLEADDVFAPDPRPARIEALVADGRLDEAGHALAGFDGAGFANAGVDGAGVDGAGVDRAGVNGAGGARRAGPRARAERLRLHGLLLAARNVPSEAEESFARALTLVESGACPLEEARVLLDLGRLLRRTGRRRAAAERLGAARAIFERLGARPLVDRSAQELEACGLEPPATVRLGLTPQELSTAMLVAGGLTNRQIARELLISVKTVEYHIGKIYTKLGIGSRVALAAKLAGGPT
ncbi:helix-turn-helix transcriptional regulator [Nonomuraea jiangxiensis]|uniref:Regulatory protein, luxR family n=1 Tax=Nonomuraea jiangxiensis TaxID=633440 RepID=A0A1G8JXY9_9ACTN|nr:helix-turn-helix transcriptional regulator [Nonomuraea jiangxiensis]SDI36013.1 regulatory protein, luxR family [Nonomuraea jiangxiensis]